MSVLLRFLYILFNILYVVAAPVLWLMAYRRKKPFPPITDTILNLSATDAAEKIRRRELKCEQLCLSYIKRIREVNPIINAVVEERFQNALQDARNIDVYLSTTMESNDELRKTKPLLGIPLTIKESCSLAGLSLCGGTLSRTGIKADKDGDAVANLRRSGAIPLLVSNTPEISLSWETTNFVTGRTNNPYDVTRTSGGSSGGEGALLGSGASLIGIGSDLAGSIRMPAMFNGVFGHKPTPKVISIKGHFPNSNDATTADYLVIGPMTRYAKDLKLMMKVMIEDNVASIMKLDEEVVMSKLNIFFMEEEGKSWILPRVQKEISCAIRQSVEHLKLKFNCQVSDYKFVNLKDSCEIGGSILSSLNDVPNLLKPENQSLAVEIVKSLIGVARNTFNLLFFYASQQMFNVLVANEYYVSQKYHLQQLFREKLGEDSVFLYPTFTSTAFKHRNYLFHSFGTSYCMIFNTLGLPSTHVPFGLDKNGLPFGIQIVAAPYQDRLCLAVAERLEEYFGGWKPPT